MNKAEVVSNISASAGITKAQAGNAYDSFVQSIIDATNKGTTVIVSGLGNFKRRQVAGRTGRNPKTGASIEIAATSKLVFKQSAGLKR